METDYFLKAKDLLDISISYLRQVHLYCYYCGEEFDNELQMAHRCGIIHLRGSGTDENDTFGSILIFCLPSLPLLFLNSQLPPPFGNSISGMGEFIG